MVFEHLFDMFVVFHVIRESTVNPNKLKSSTLSIFIPSICRMGFTMFACCFLDIMYLVLLLSNDNLLILSHLLILDSSLLIYDVMFLLLSSLNESIVLQSVVSSAYIMT